MPFKSEVYIQAEVLTTWWLYRLGQLFTLGTPPVHSRLWWGMFNGSSYDYFMTELTSEKPGPATRIVGQGDGYCIQISKVNSVPATASRVDDILTSNIEKLATSYADISNGDLSDSFCRRDWYPEPQGHGGPMYDNRNTSNTFVFWLLTRASSSGAIPPKPKGALGWGNMPMFPGPKKGD